MWNGRVHRSICAALAGCPSFLYLFNQRTHYSTYKSASATFPPGCASRRSTVHPAFQRSGNQPMLFRCSERRSILPYHPTQPKRLASDTPAAHMPRMSACPRAPHVSRACQAPARRHIRPVRCGAADQTNCHCCCCSGSAVVPHSPTPRKAPTSPSRPPCCGCRHAPGDDLMGGARAAPPHGGVVGSIALVLCLSTHPSNRSGMV